MSQATKKLKLCQHFLQTTPYMTHQSINHKKYEIFSLHTGIRPSESLKHYGDEKRLEKNFQRLYNFKFTCCTHTERQNS